MSPRYSTVRADKVDYSFWLVFGSDGTMRFSRGEPDITRGERKMKANAVLPMSLFRTPELKLTIGVDDPGAAAFNIVVGAVQDELRPVIGVDIDVRVESPRADI